MNIRNKLQSSAAYAALNGLSIAVFATLLFTSLRPVGYGLTAITLAAITWRSATAGHSATMSAQMIITCGLLADASRHLGDVPTAALVVLSVALMTLIVTQPTLHNVITRPRMMTNLPGYRAARDVPIRPPLLYGANIVLIALLAVIGLAGAPAWPILTATTLVGGAVAIVGLQALRIHLHTAEDEKAFRDALLGYDPRFALYFSAPDATEYHVQMWLPYLERVGRPFVVIVREARSYPIIAASTTAPVIYCPTVPFVDQAVTDRMRACFYVNNGAKNSHMVRFAHLTHIQLLHGDSDKASSANPVTAMFDRIFVAGQAGIDRYAHAGVTIPADRFDLVGRPQVSALRVSDEPIADIADRTVLYATTWVGLYNDANYCSLHLAEPIVRALLARGVRVILRPHPYASRHADSARHVARLEAILAEDRAKTGRDHLYGAVAALEMSLTDCINAADALVSDVSSVASDWLYTGKPFALTNTLEPDADIFEAAFPLARGAYVVDRGLSNLAPVLDDLLGADPIAARRHQVKAYVLGDFAPERYIDAFVDAARRYIDGPPQAGPAPTQTHTASVTVADESEQQVGTDVGARVV